MSIGVRADDLGQTDIENLEKITKDSYFYAEDFADDEQVFVFEVLHCPWTNANSYAETKTLGIQQINKLYNENREKIIKYQNWMKTSGLNHLVDRVDVIVHVTEL